MSEYVIPTATEVDAAVRRLTTYQLRRVFYEGLTNPHWVKPLADLDVFTNPPEPEPTADGYIKDVFWPEVSYLLNVAADAPVEVIDVLLGLESTSNSWVRRAAFVIGARVPADQAARLKPLVTAWSKAGGFGWRTDPRDLVSFAMNLIEGEQRFGITFANALFRPREAEGDSSDPVVELKAYWYAEELPRIATALGTDGLKTILPWLTQYERIKKSVSSTFDHSGFSRSTVARRGGGHRDIEDALIDTVRDLASRDFGVDPDKTWQLFQSNEIVIAHRIAMYSLAHAIEEAADPDLLAKLVSIGTELLAGPKCRDEGARLEFVALARALAEQSERQVLEQVIEEGHFTDEDRGRIRMNMAASGEAAEEIESSITRWDDHWRHQVLSGVGRELLTPALVAQLERLDAAHGVLEDPLRPSFQVTSWVGPNSPVEQDDMAAMSPSELLAQLESWHVTGERLGPGPSHEGQARVLSTVLAAKPNALGDATGLVERLRPVYIRAAFSGWEAAFKADLDLDWPVVIGTLTDAVRHGRESHFPLEGGQYDDDADFTSAKQAAVGLLEELSKPKNAERITSERLAVVASLILQASGDDAAWADYAGSDGLASGMDPLTTSLNWQWPIMLRALVNLISHGRGTDWYEASATALRRELAREDPRGASRAVLGEGLGRLHDRAPEWLHENLATYFGSADSLTRDQQIALTTAIAMHYYHLSLYQLLSGSMIATLREEYDIAVGWGDRATPNERIGQWVVQAIIRGHIAEDDELRQEFYETAPPDVRGDAIGHIAWSFLHAEAVDDAIRDRLGALWDERVRHVEANLSDKAELKDFYWFVRCGKFSASWWLPRLRRAVELDPELDTHGMIGEQLAQAASRLPADALAALTRLLKPEDSASRDNWDLRREALAPVIAAAMDSGDAQLEHDATDLMNAMGARGETDLDRRVAALRAGADG